MPSFRSRILATAAALTLAGGGALAVAGPASALVAHSSGVLQQGCHGDSVTAVQRRLAALGYWVGGADGVYGTNTAQAVMALQKVAGLERDGVVGPMTQAALDRGVRPHARTTSGHVVEVDKAHQVMIVADNGRVSSVYNVSTGGDFRYTSGGRTEVAHTPEGSFSVYRSVPGWEAGPLGDMYRPRYFTGGIAIHGVGSPSGVGARPASHGCVRVTTQTQDRLIGSGQLASGTRVVVY